MVLTVCTREDQEVKNNERILKMCKRVDGTQQKTSEDARKYKFLIVTLNRLRLIPFDCLYLGGFM